MELALTRERTERTYGNEAQPFRIWVADGAGRDFYYFPTAADAMKWAIQHNADELYGIWAFGMEGSGLDGIAGWSEWYDEDGDDLSTIIDRLTDGV